MSEKISKDLLNIITEISDNESKVFKINASIFVRNSEKIISEKIVFLKKMLNTEAKNCEQKQDNYNDKIKLIIDNYKQKLKLIREEVYFQYKNIQNELQEAKLNRRIAIINYQKLVNNKENILASKEYKDFVDMKQDLLYKLKLANTQHEYNQIYQQVSFLKSPLKDDKEMKEVIKKKNEIYKEIIEKCNKKFIELSENFEKIINEYFSISSKSLQIINESNILKKLLNKFSNIFVGRKKYIEVLEQYNKIINNIDSSSITKQMRNETIEFVADILEMRGVNKKELEEARIGGLYGRDINKTRDKK